VAVDLAGGLAHNAIAPLLAFQNQFRSRNFDHSLIDLITLRKFFAAC